MAVDRVIGQQVRQDEQTDIHEDLPRELHPEILTGEILDGPVLEQADGRIDDHGDTNPFGELPVAIDVLEHVHCKGEG